METINYFQYRLYSDNIKALAGTKKPLKDLISKFLKLSKSFSYSFVLEHGETASYCYALIMEAVSLSGAISPLTKAQKELLANKDEQLIRHKAIPIDKAHEILRRTLRRNYLYPENIEGLLYIGALSNTITAAGEGFQYNINAAHVKEFSTLSNRTHWMNLILKDKFPGILLPLESARTNTTHEDLDTIQANINTFTLLQELHNEHANSNEQN